MVDVRVDAAMGDKAEQMHVSVAFARTPERRHERFILIERAVGNRAVDALKVLIQLVDPMDLTGDFIANVSVSSKGVPNTNEHLILKKGRGEVSLLRDAGDTKSRFAEPSILVD